MTPNTQPLRGSLSVAQDRLDLRQCEDFLVHEARLLDEAPLVDRAVDSVLASLRPQG